MKKSYVIILFLFSLLSSYSQDETQEQSKKEERKNRPAYIGIGIGVGTSNLKDFATSPLTYSGIQSSIATYFLRENLKREMEIGLYYNTTKYNSNFNGNTSTSLSRAVSIYYSQLYQIKSLSSEKLNLKIGGLFNLTSNLRVNPSFMNNSTGVDIIPTLFGSAKVEKHFSNNEKPVRKIWFIKYTKSNLSLRLNAGIYNSSYRNGFIYSGHSSVINEPSVFDGYEYNSFSGYRMSSNLSYTLNLQNKNQVQFSYLWDAYQTNTYDNLAVASHTIRIALLFNTNNK